MISQYVNEILKADGKLEIRKDSPSPIGSCHTLIEFTGKDRGGHRFFLQSVVLVPENENEAEIQLEKSLQALAREVGKRQKGWRKVTSFSREDVGLLNGNEESVVRPSTYAKLT